MAVGLGGGRNSTLTALDVGTSKVCCFVAQESGGAIRVAGIGYQASKGLAAGAVVDMQAAEESIRGAVDAAERMAGQTVDEVYLNLSACRPASTRVTAEVAINGYHVGDADIGRALAEARAHSDAGEGRIIHAIPVGYSIDGVNGVREPRGMFGARLGVDLHVVTAAPGPLRNLALCVERGDLRIAQVVESAYASGLASLVDDEMELGVTVIDLGGGTTSLGVFLGGSLVHVDSVALGGQHVTNDIARGLATPAVHAERMKTLYGSAVPSPSDHGEVINVPLVGEDEAESTNPVARSMLVGIIRPRLEEIFEIVRDRLDSAGARQLAGRRVVLTGGASQLQGVRELASRVLDRQVRLGRPTRIGGLAEAMGGPAFTACAGLLCYAARAARDEMIEAAAAPSRLGRLRRWLSESV